jgi:uncharacterized protein YuzB (UPF0349 family)
MNSNYHRKKTIKQQLLWLAMVGFLSVAGSSSILALSNHHHGDPISSVEDLSNHQKNQYKKDATRLALRQLVDGNNFEVLDPEVPKEMVESIYSSLIAIHTSGLPEANIVTAQHKLHTFPTPTVDRLVVIYKRDATWATPLRLGDDVTDNDKINELSAKFKLTIDRHVEWDEEHFSFNMRSEESMNIAPLAKDLSTVESVTLVDMMEPNGDGNDIEIKKLANGWEINYIIKFDGCISGCKKRHTWSFEVINGKVNFKGESGDELPKWMR